MKTAIFAVFTYILQDIGGWVPFSITNSSFTLNALSAFLNSSCWFFFNATYLAYFSLDILSGKSKMKQSLKTKLISQLRVFLTAKTSAQAL